MIAEFGHFALTLALAVAVVQATLPLIGAARNDAGLMALAPACAMVQFGLVALAFGALMHAYIVSDFSLAAVAQNSHTAKPMLYKVAGTWGNHEGSMLLWALILALYGAAVAAFGWPTSPVSNCTWRCKLFSATRSPSAMPMRPSPAAAQ